jgi:tetratricopeptide (TPR) repeat protein
MRKLCVPVLVCAALAACMFPAISWGAVVTVREAPLVVPTYPAAGPDPSPLFYEGRTYQGARGPIYPYPIIDKLFAHRQDQTYRAVWLENEYIRICVLPDMGGRIFEAVDKTNGYNFFYRQHVIKPALIGMLGAWISGGVEWNIPHHHRASSFLPIPYRIEESADGSKTVWVGETELRQRMRWVMGLTLRPGKAYIEATLRLFNRTPVTNSFLYFANVAVHTNKDYQVIFPPSVEWATQHSKVEFSSWPVSHQTYGGVDFRKGVDVSWYKNHPSPTSMFAFECKEDFLAGYDHGKQAGTLHVAERGIMPGKKFFTWGTGGDGKAWDDLLTDTDGAYLELMVGGFSDNQPDYSWIQPYEVKTVHEFWYPFREIGGVKNANLDAAVNLEVEGGAARVGVATTEARPDARVVVDARGKRVFERAVALAPDKPFTARVDLPAGTVEPDIRVAVFAGTRELIAYQPAPKKNSAMPAPVTPPPAPAAIRTNEELLLAGQRLEQFHSPAREPDPYYLEAVKRDPSDARANTALALLDYRRGLYAGAERRLQVAVARLSHNYTRPRDGEAYYYLGLAQRAQGKESEAVEAFERASWSHGWAAASNYALAESAGRRKDYAKALEYVDRALATGAENTKAIALRAALLRHLGRGQEAGAALETAARLDPLDPWVRREMRATSAITDPQPYLELALDYGNAGLDDDAVAALGELIASYPDESRAYPMAFYALGFYLDRQAKPAEALAAYKQGQNAASHLCFPFRLEEIAILERVIERNRNDARAHYYLGNALYDRQPGAAIAAWEQSRRIEPRFAMLHRNLALAYARRQNDVQKAIPEFEAAFALQKDPRWMYELDELYQAAGVAPRTRLAFFEQHPKIAADRDDVLTRQIMLQVQTGDYDNALKLLGSRKFNIWEGASISAHDWYVDAHLLRGHRNLKAGRAQEALADYMAALEYPANLGSGKPYRDERVHVIEYAIGAAEERLGESAKAKEYYTKAAAGADAPRRAGRRMRGDSAEVAYHRGLALVRLGDAGAAREIFEALVASGREQPSGGAVDDFAKFGERTAANVSQARAHYVAGLGQLGLGHAAEARAEFEQAVKLDVNQMWAAYYLEPAAR